MAITYEATKPFSLSFSSEYYISALIKKSKLKNITHEQVQKYKNYTNKNWKTYLYKTSICSSFDRALKSFLTSS